MAYWVTRGFGKDHHCCTGNFNTCKKQGYVRNHGLCKDVSHGHCFFRVFACARVYRIWHHYNDADHVVFAVVARDD